MVNFVLGDFVANLNNAKKQHLNSINVRNTSLTREVLNVMVAIGIIRDLTFLDTDIEVVLKYINRKCVFSRIKLVSLPSRRIYIDIPNLIKLKNRVGAGAIYILSTNVGLKIDSECLLNSISGEILLKIEL